MSILGVDIGQKRIGLAQGTMIAEEFKTLNIKLPADNFLDMQEGTQQALDELLDVVRSQHIEAVVVGVPQRDKGDEGDIVGKISEFITKLRDIVDIPVRTTDETLTSVAAEEILRDEGVSIEEAKERVDQVAAKLILQQYLEDHQ